MSNPPSTQVAPPRQLDGPRPPDPSFGAIRVYGDKLLNRENESYKSFRVNLSDPCSKILPAALKKYKINDDWKQYALFIIWKNTGIFPKFLLLLLLSCSFHLCVLSPISSSNLLHLYFAYFSMHKPFQFFIS